MIIFVFFDRIIKSRKDSIFDKIPEITDGIIVINDRKLRINYSDELDNF